MQPIPTHEVLSRLRKQNPWWQPPHELAAPFSEWRARPYIELFLPVLTETRIRRALVLMGPRRVGKTVMIHHAIQHLLDTGVPPRAICYISVDHPIYVGCSLDRLLDIYSQATGVDLASDETYVFFDEIQYLRDWEIHLKSLVDGFAPLRAVASGSAAAALRLKSRESGAGRFTDFLLPPLTFFEYLQLTGNNELIDAGLDYIEDRVPEPERLESLNERFVHYLNFGGYPEVVMTPEIQQDPERFIKRDIVDKVLLRDLPSLYGIEDIQELNALFATLAYNSGGEITLEGLSQSSNVSKPTIKRYLAYLEAAFLIQNVHRVDRDGRRFRRANFFKTYLTNSSLRAALFSPLVDGDRALGALVETGIFSQWFHSNERLHYARWKEGEVDIVHLPAEHKKRWAVEVKWSDRPAKRPALIRKAVSFCQQNEIETLVVTTKTRGSSERYPGVDVNFVPAALQALSIGLEVLGETYA